MTDRLAPGKRYAYQHQGRTVYEWDQRFGEVNVYVQTPPGVRGKDLKVEITQTHVKFGIVNNPSYLDVRPVWRRGGAGFRKLFAPPPLRGGSCGRSVSTYDASMLRLPSHAGGPVRAGQGVGELLDAR